MNAKKVTRKLAGKFSVFFYISATVYYFARSKVVFLARYLVFIEVIRERRRKKDTTKETDRETKKEAVAS